MIAYLYVLVLLVLLPIRLIVGILGQYLWFPGFKSANDVYTLDVEKEFLESHIQKAYSSIDTLAVDGDGAKFLSIYHFCQRFFVSLFSGYETDVMYSLYHEDKTFKRYPILEDNKNVPTVSGDMMAGFVFARSADIITGCKRYGAEYVKIIKNVVNFRIPFTVPHPMGEIWGRGFILPIWSDGGDVLKTCAMLDTAIETSEQCNTNTEWNLIALKWLLLITNFPLILISVDAGVFLGKFHITKWFGHHSRFMYFLAGYLVTGSWYYKMAMYRLVKRHGSYNPDIAMLYNAFICKENTPGAIRMIADYYHFGKGTKTYSGETTAYYDLTKIFTPSEMKHIGAIRPIGPQYRVETYVWERDPMKFRNPYSSESRSNEMDLILPLTLYYTMYKNNS